VKGATTQTASALPVHKGSSIKPSDDPTALTQTQLTREPPSTTAASPSISQEDAIPQETEQLDRVSQTQPAKTYSSDSDLWDKALRQLQESGEHKSIVAVVELFGTCPAADHTNPECGPGSVRVLAKDIKEKMEQEINRKQHNSETYRFVEKIVSVLNKFVAVGDVAINFDPVHAASPWAAVRFVLVVSSSTVPEACCWCTSF
jgi:hypothetical protein